MMLSVLSGRTYLMLMCGDTSRLVLMQKAAEAIPCKRNQT